MKIEIYDAGLKTHNEHAIHTLSRLRCAARGRNQRGQPATAKGGSRLDSGGLDAAQHGPGRATRSASDLRQPDAPSIRAGNIVGCAPQKKTRGLILAPCPYAGAGCGN